MMLRLVLGGTEGDERKKVKNVRASCEEITSSLQLITHKIHIKLNGQFNPEYPAAISHTKYQSNYNHSLIQLIILR